MNPKSRRRTQVPKKIAEKVLEIYNTLDGMTNEDAVTALLSTISCVLAEYPEEHLFDFLEDMPNIVKNGIDYIRKD